MRACRALAVARAAAVSTVLVLLGIVLGAAPAVADPLAVTVVQTNPAGHSGLAAQPSLEFRSGSAPRGIPAITITDIRRFQAVSGFGAALTDSSAWLISTLPAAARAQLMQTLFSPTALNLRWVRIAVGASDYTASGTPYTYDDVAPGHRDPSLRHFSIARDDAYVIPELRAARAIDPGLNVLATPWTAPAWMKGNDALSNLGDSGYLLSADYPVYAAYLVRFLQAYAAAGVPVTALTPANEPGNPTSYPGMDLSAGAEANLLGRYLLPDLRRAQLDTDVFGSDLGWYSQPFATSLATSSMRSGLAGIAWHCYFGSPDVMSTVHAIDPALAAFVTECSPGISSIPVSEVIISSLRNWATGVMLWNLALAPNGGPVQQPNTGCPGCSPVVAIGPKTHSVYYGRSFAELAQASAFIEPGARRVYSTSFVTYPYVKPGVDFVTRGVDDVALLNPDGSRVLITYNNGVDTHTFAVIWHNRYIEYTLAPGATATFKWDIPSQ